MTIDQHDSIQFAFQSTIGNGKFATRLHRERMFVLFKRYFTDPSSLGVALWGEFLLHYPGYLHGPKYVTQELGAEFIGALREFWSRVYREGGAIL